MAIADPIKIGNLLLARLVIILPKLLITKINATTAYELTLLKILIKIDLKAMIVVLKATDHIVIQRGYMVMNRYNFSTYKTT
jgi:hypothetical protein